MMRQLMRSTTRGIKEEGMKKVGKNWRGLWVIITVVCGMIIVGVGVAGAQ
jgi:hypothetical protein